MSRLVVRLPKPHPKQKEIEDCTKKRIVVPTGRRFGKTTLVARKSVKLASVGRKVLYTAPVIAQTDAYWKMCTEWLDDAIGIGQVGMSLTKRDLTFPGGGSIAARTASKPEHLRGDYADYLIMDEYAYQNPEIWTKVGMPMLLDNDGDAVFISSPAMRNHFYMLYRKAQENPRWATFHATSLDNPHLSRRALAALVEDMTPLDYDQEILAKFIKGEGSVFSFRIEDFIDPETLDVILGRHKGHRIVAGLDWGRKKDYTVMDIGCATCQKEVHIDRFGEISYPTQRDRIKGVYDQFTEAGYEMEVLAEANAMGLPNIEQLREDGVPVIEWDMSHSSKAIVVQGLRLVLSQRSWKWLNDPDSVQELETYEMKITPKGNVTYGAPSGLHDDIVVGKMLMLHQALTGELTLV